MNARTQIILLASLKTELANSRNWWCLAVDENFAYIYTTEILSGLPLCENGLEGNLFLLLVYLNLFLFAIYLVPGFLIRIKRLEIWFGLGSLLSARLFGTVEMILFLTKSKLTRFCRSFSGEHTGYISGRSCSVMSKPRTRSPRWART